MSTRSAMAMLAACLAFSSVPAEAATPATTALPDAATLEFLADDDNGNDAVPGSETELADLLLLDSEAEPANAKLPPDLPGSRGRGVKDEAVHVPPKKY